MRATLGFATFEPRPKFPSALRAERRLRRLRRLFISVTATAPNRCHFFSHAARLRVGHCQGLGTSRGRPPRPRCWRGFGEQPRIFQGRRRNSQLGVRWMDSMALHADHDAGRPPEQWKMQLSGDASLGGCHWAWSIESAPTISTRRRKAVHSCGSLGHRFRYHQPQHQAHHHQPQHHQPHHHHRPIDLTTPTPPWRRPPPKSPLRWQTLPRWQRGQQ